MTECDRIIDGDVPETTGKFGTGFLTTHLLSRIVEISGVYQHAVNLNGEFQSRYHKFSLRLDRTPETKPEMIAKYKEAYDHLLSFDNP